MFASLKRLHYSLVIVPRCNKSGGCVGIITKPFTAFSNDLYNLISSLSNPNYILTGDLN